MHFAKPHPLLLKHLTSAHLDWSSVLDTSEWHSLWAENMPPEELEDDLKFMADWINRGHHADMNFLTRNTEARQNAQLILPEVKSILSLVIPYAPGKNIRKNNTRDHLMQECEKLPETHADHESATHKSALLNSTARYARVPDYHKEIRKELDRVLAAWQTEALATGLYSEKQTWRVVSDSLPFLDRAHARLARLGFIGKNTMLIRPGIGSYFFIAHVMLSTPYQLVSSPDQEKPLSADPLAELSCGDCTRCLDACPTQALITAGHLDANKCLSYLSIEHRGTVNDEYIKHFARQFYGCDICQEVCPYNFRTLPLQTINPFKKHLSSLQELTTNHVALMTQVQYEKWFGGTALTRAKYSGLVRNALYSLHANNDQKLNEILLQRENDPDPTIKSVVGQLRRISTHPT